MTDEVHPTQQACLEAIDRIARSPDGAVLYVFLQRRLMAVPYDNSEGALRSNHGERRFASELISLMAKGIFESGGRTSSSGGGSSGDIGTGEQPLIVPSPKPVRVNAGTGSRRRINADTVVPGWNDTPGDQT